MSEEYKVWALEPKHFYWFALIFLLIVAITRK
jgi:hypothetical protein